MRWIGKIASLVGVVIIVSILSFLMTTILPGDPAVVIAGANADNPEVVQAIRERLELDEPLPVRYWDWFSGVVTGDFGRAAGANAEPVANKLSRTVPNTLQLIILAELLAFFVAVPLAVFSAYRANRGFDRFSTGFAFLLLATPNFVLGIVLITVFVEQLNLTDTLFYSVEDGVLRSLRSSILPVVTLSAAIIAVYIRVLRTDVIATLQEDFILNARAKGLKPSYILFRHALRPSAFSLLTVAAINFGTLIGGSVIIENLFAIDGVGSLLVQSVSSRDVITVQAIVLVIAVTYVTVNFAVDLLYSSLDPRIRRG